MVERIVVSEVTVHERIQTPTRVERPSESLLGKTLQLTTGQGSLASAHVLKGMTSPRNGA